MRFGPLSDLAVKASHPEFFTLDIATTAIPNQQIYIIIT
jgi:hypothetical protein